MDQALSNPEVWKSLATEVVNYVSKAPTILTILLGTWLLSRFAVRIATGAGRLARTDPAVVRLIASSVKFVAWIFGFTAVFNALGLTQIAITLGGTVALVGMSLASGLNTIPQDLLAGIFLISDEDFKAGRMVKTGGIEGVLREVTIRKTKIVDAEGKLHVIPNRTIDQATYVIYGPNNGNGNGNAKA